MSDGPRPLAPASPLLPGHDDTIAALATAPGRGALAIVRVSGPRAFAVVRPLCDRWPVAPRTATRVRLADPRDEAPLDDALLVRYDAPRSFTGEDVVELTVHGGPAVAAGVLAALVAGGAREALPGEFTRRAVLAGKLDLVQAEAVGDLVEARTAALRRAALHQLDGGLTRRIAELRERVLDLEALVAYDLDFPEEDDGPVPRERVLALAAELVEHLDALLHTEPRGALVRDGATVVLAGAPNAGKSALFNALLGEGRALVTAVPGTTRDAIDALLDVEPIPLRLVDTAGLREATDAVERLGIEVSARWLAGARVVLVCGEDEHSLGAAWERVGALTSAVRLPVRTKRDDLDASAEAPAHAPAHAPGEVRVERPIAVSAERRLGLGRLLAAVQHVLRDSDDAGGAQDARAPLLLHARQGRAVREARDEVLHFLHAWGEGSLPVTVAAVHLRAATHALESLVGAVDAEEVMGRVFARFCVGK